VRNASCLFCKIIGREINSEIIRENDNVIVIKDINPKAAVHYLIIPKKHFENLLTLDDDDKQMAHSIMAMARDLGKSLKEPQAFNLISNNGAAVGQSVFHSHWHFLSGSNIKDITGTDL
jgi:histidine triad (HIT) family protein